MKRVLTASFWTPGRRWLIWGVFLAALTTGLLRPEPVSLADEVLPHEAMFSAFKTVHITAFALLVVLTAWLPVTSRTRWRLLAFVSAYAMVTEYLQNFVPSRTASWMDVGFNHVGIVLGLALSWRVWKKGLPSHARGEAASPYQDAAGASRQTLESQPERV
jgi:VanZ family protein